MELKGLKRGTTFSIQTSSDLNWILNENSKKSLGLKFNRICYNLSEIFQELMEFY
jgi:hypothetical protein